MASKTREIHSRPRNKLCAEQVQEIVRRRKAGETYRSLAQEFGCSAANLVDIFSGRTWKGVSNLRYMASKPRLRGVNHPKSKLTEEDVRSILRRRQTGITYSQLAREFNVHPVTICTLCLGRTWSHVTGLPRAKRKFSKSKTSV